MDEITAPDWRSLLELIILPHEHVLVTSPNTISHCEAPSHSLQFARTLIHVHCHTTHVVLLLRHTTRPLTFRLYDNDSDERLRGTYDTLPAEQVIERLSNRTSGADLLYIVTDRGSPVGEMVDRNRRVVRVNLDGGQKRKARQRPREDS